MIQSRDDYLDYRAADLAGQGLTHWRAHYRLTRRVAYFLRLLRRVEYLMNCRRDPLGRALLIAARLRLARLGERLGYTIPPNVFGPGLSPAHAGTIVVHPRARVGRECRIHQGVTIGEVNGKVPTLGDGVNIAPNAGIYGGVTIGDRVGVWANSVVLSDVPSDVSVAGAPAQIKSR